ncbi:hypothetical protein CGCSCA4_v007989 [Colletotrichum siamense]|uniref:Uncharacterized protein n=1 Tax=Colletotrichum siamense TaxID=690259 RepID=A0A9P5K9H1_COLSI|nr:hypothetical protein CGCSCA4_v007989 [Colletotrichum siamense]KAF4863433.1 hypothetical protein CGCSCA2_v002867 [Colletotrichum siamense]
MSYPHQPYDGRQMANSPPQPIPCHSSSHHFGMGHAQTGHPHSSPQNAAAGQPDGYWYQPAAQQQMDWNATLPSQPYGGSGNDFSTAQPDPAMGDGIPGAYYSSSMQSASTAFTVGTPSSQDFRHMGAWNPPGANFDLVPAQEDPRGRDPIQLNLQNLPGRSERSMSTYVNRPSSPNHDEKKKKKKHSKSSHRQSKG